jgi:putative tryptophan/tyrosine transport system substrate-binding protein
MNRRRIMVAMLGGTLALPRFVLAQAHQKVARLAVLDPGSEASSAERIQDFKQGLRELGYVEGQNLSFDARFANGNVDQHAILADELIRLKPDCIIAVGLGSARAFARLTKTIPIVIPNIDADPVKEGLIASLARPGGNITGLMGVQWELADKRIEILREVAPKAERIAVLFDPRSNAGHAHVEGTQAAARRLGVQLQLLEAPDPHAIDRAFEAARETRAEAISVIHIGQIQTERSKVIKHAAEARLPAIYSSIPFVDDGGLIAYAPDAVAQYRRAAVFVDKILRGTRPADLPMEQPTKFELVVNLKTANALGITIPPTLLARADRLIE